MSGAHPTGRSVLAFLGVWIGGAAVLAGAGWYLASRMPGHDGTAPTVLAVALAYLSVPLAALVVYRPAGLRDRLAVRAVDRRAYGTALLVWLVALAIAAAGYLGAGAATGHLLAPGLDLLRRATDLARFPHATGPDWALIVPRALLLAAIAEELLFRGVLFGWLGRHLPTRATIAVTSVLFALEHLYLVVMPIGLLFGVALGWLRARTGSVLPGMLVHVLTDTLLFVLALTAAAHGVTA